jgi:hypothetical protein
VGAFVAEVPYFKIAKTGGETHLFFVLLGIEVQRTMSQQVEIIQTFD